jgi:putative hydroxymethylpyrimidine transport system permease protein
MRLARLARPVLTLAGLLVLWQLFVVVSGVPHFMLPPPIEVLATLLGRAGLILGHAWVTVLEILLGFLIGALAGVAAALTLASFMGARRWLLPVIVASQAIPVFALAPLLVLWFGYGIASKVAMAVLIIFFPVTAAFYDGLRRTAGGWLELARTMNASPGAMLFQIRLPAALPALASGLRVAAAVAPIGAVVGEWVGSSEGLGYLMLHANARMQTDLMFAALLFLCLAAILFWFTVDRLMRHLVRWQPETRHASI